MIRRLLTGLNRQQWLRFQMVLACYRAGREVPDWMIERDVLFILLGLEEDKDA